MASILVVVVRLCASYCFYFVCVFVFPENRTHLVEEKNLTFSHYYGFSFCSVFFLFGMKFYLVKEYM